MNEYLVSYDCAEGYRCSVIVLAANRTMALEIFADLGIEDATDVECLRIVREPQEEADDSN